MNAPLNAPASAPLASEHKGGPPPRRTVPLWLLALVAFSGTLAMHIFVPALPRAQADLGASTAAMQLTISLYILGLAGGQLVYGPLADRFGRRPVLMAGLSLYTAASLAATLAPSVNALIAARLFQALGGCSGLVLARAIVRDTSAPADTTRRLALMNLMITVGPGLAPLVGGLLADAAGWRSIFLAMTLLGLVNLLLTWRLLPETGQATEGDAVGLMESYGQLLRAPAFWAYAVGGGCATTSLYGFVAAAPFIFIGELHQPAARVGGYIALLVLGVWVGSVLASRLIAHVSVSRLLVGANGVSVSDLSQTHKLLHGEETEVLLALRPRQSVSGAPTVVDASRPRCVLMGRQGAKSEGAMPIGSLTEGKKCHIAGKCLASSDSEPPSRPLKLTCSALP